MTPALLLPTLFLLLALPLHAQRAPDTRADSAARARGHWRAAGQAYRAQRWPEALRAAHEARSAWPAQPFYLLGLASIAARAGDTAAAAEALGAYADLGLGADLAPDEDFAALHQAPVLQAVAERLRANLAPLVRSRVAFRLADAGKDFFPEGIACEERSGVCFMGSLRHRTVLRVAKDGTARELVPSGRDGLLGAMALGLSPDGRRLWVASAALPQTQGLAAADSGGAALHAFDARTGALLRRLAFPRDSIPANPGDLLVARNDEVFVSDSRRGLLWRVPPTGDTMAVFARSPLLFSPQGIAESADGRRLYVADYSLGIVAVERATGTVRPVAAPAGTTTVGIDGLARSGEWLVGVQNGVRPARVVRLRLGADPYALTGLEVLDRNLPIATEPTSGSMVGGEYWYVANSQWEAYDAAGVLKPGAELGVPVVLRVGVVGPLAPVAPVGGETGAVAPVGP